METAESAWDVEMGLDLPSFIKRISKMHSIIYFHNLKFDGFFILDYLFRVLKYDHVNKYPLPGQFSTIINHMGQFYGITINWGKGKLTEFRDSYKKLPYKASVVAKAFKLSEAKGVIDYKAARPVGHLLTRAEREYLATDVMIILKALKLQFAKGMTKLTVGADALEDFKTMLQKPVFQKMFPVMSDSMDDEIRRAYRGGFTYADPRHIGKITTAGRTYDVNSLYPSVMYDRLLPYGTPVFSPGCPEPTKDYPLFIVSITFTARLKKDHIPCIQIKQHPLFAGTEYQKVIREPVTMTCTSVDLALYEEHYDMNIISYNGGWLFRAVSGVFKDYIDKWMEVKMNSTGGMRELAKLHLNALYGKFATNPIITGKIPLFEDNIVKLRQGPEERKEPVYTAMGVFITAYARDVMIRAAQDNYDSFAYCDTDSLHLLRPTDPIGLRIDPKALGAWKFEYAFSRALFIRAKGYIEHKTADHHHTPEECELDTHGAHCEHETHFAGLPVDVSETLVIEDFWSKRKFSGKLNPRRVPGGIILEDVDYTLPAW